MMKIAITGGIGSGKSAVCKEIAALGYPVFSCDDIYKQLQRSPEYIQKIEDAFPSAVINGTIDRNILSSIVFSSPKALETLNAISHPMIMETLHNQMQSSGEKIAFAEVPLLYEGNFQSGFDKIIVVLRNKEERIRSVMQRSNLSKEEVETRIQNQFQHDNYIQNDPSVVYLKNEGDLSTLKTKVQSLIKELL